MSTKPTRVPKMGTAPSLLTKSEKKSIGRAPTELVSNIRSGIKLRDRFVKNRERTGQCVSGKSDEDMACGDCIGSCYNQPCWFDVTGFTRWIISNVVNDKSQYTTYYGDRLYEVTLEEFVSKVKGVTPMLQIAYKINRAGVEFEALRFRRVSEKPGQREAFVPYSDACSMLGDGGCQMSVKHRPIEGITSLSCGTPEQRRWSISSNSAVLHDDWHTDCGRWLIHLVRTFGRKIHPIMLEYEKERPKPPPCPSHALESAKGADDIGKIVKAGMMMENLFNIFGKMSSKP